MAVEERKKATPIADLGKEALRVKGFWRSYKWLILRRFSQFGILALFLVGPWFGIWIVKGNLASSLTLDVLPLTDPFVLLQTLAAGYLPQTTAVIGALIVLVFYMIFGGRAYCSWVCPINIVTDAAQWLRNKLNIKSELKLSRANRYWFLGAVLGVSAATGMLAWEFINPVSMVQRALIFGMGLAWAVIVMIFLLDAFISRRAWCGHLCPVGAFYSLLGKTSLFRVNAVALDRCDRCMECFAVCPEQKVITPVLKKNGRPTSIIKDINCTNCGRCIDICSTDVFRFDLRFHDLVKPGDHLTTGAPPTQQSHQREVIS